MKQTIQHTVTCLLASAMICLAGCGGSSDGGGGTTSGTSAGSGSTTPPTASPPTTTPPTTPPPATPPTGAPTITTQPAAQTVSVGQHAFFSVVATQATSYQWFMNGAMISGATSSTYSAPAAAATDAGEKFSVTVTNSLGSAQSSDAALAMNPNADGSPPDAFWGNPTALAAATQSMMFSFVNQTNGKYPDSQVFWSVQGKTADGTQVNEVHSIAEQATYDMPPLSSARMYFALAANAAAVQTSGNTSYYDFIEFNIGRSSASQPYNFNGDTTRVDAFGLKTAIKLHCGDGTDIARGEDYGTFLEDRAVTFQKYLSEVPAEFNASGAQVAPYRIVEPGSAGFGAGGANANYFQSYIDTVWANNNIDVSLVPKPTPFLSFTTNQLPDLSAAMERHVADAAGTFTTDGHLVNPQFWANTPSSAFYPAAAANFYAKFWHTHGIGGFAYGFPYDDVGGHSSDIGCNSPTYLVVAIGW
jgi:Beta-1,3-glucanase